MDYVKLSDLVGKSFRVDKVWGYDFVKGDAENKKMLKSDSWQEGYRKVYNLETDKGKLSLSASQLGQLLELYQQGGEAKIVGRGVGVKSNGKSGMDIRYFFNKAEVEEQVIADVPEGDVDMSAIEELFPG